MANDWSQYYAKPENPNLAPTDWSQYYTKPEQMEQKPETLMDILSTKLAENIPGLGKVAEFAYPFTKPNEELWSNLPPLVAHGAQGFLNIPASAANLIPGVNIPHFDFAKYTHPERESSIPEDIAEFGGGAYGGGSALIKGSKYLPKIGNLGKSGFSQYLGNVLKGGLGGYIGSEAKGEEGDYLGKGRLLGAFFGSMAPATGGAIQFGKSLLPKNITEKILMGVQKAESKSPELYNKFLKPAQEAGLKVKTPKMSLEKQQQIIREAPKEYRKTYKKWLENPDMKNSHKLYKATKKLESNLQRKVKAGTISTPETDILESSGKLSRLVEKNMENSLRSAGRTDLIKALSEANKHYIQNVLPHRNPAITEYLGKLKSFKASEGKGRIEPSYKEMVKKLQKDTDFQAALGREYPQLMHRERLPYYLGGAGAGASGLGYLGKNLLYD